MNTGDVELIGSYWTLAGGAYPHTDREFSPFDFRDRVEAAARAGFRGLGLWHADLVHVRERYSLADMRRILDDNGMVHLELEFLTDWFMEGERRAQSDLTRAMLLDTAGALGARHVKVGDFFNEACPMSRLVDSFGGLCADAAAHGTVVLFELMPFANVHTLDDLLVLLEGANADNGGVILDLWHMVKMGITNGDLARIPPRFLRGIELNDGMLADSGDLVDETVNHRRLCGEGEFDVPGFIRAMQAQGYDGPWGIEVLSAEMREWPLEKLVRRSWETTRAQFET